MTNPPINGSSEERDDPASLYERMETMTPDKKEEGTRKVVLHANASCSPTACGMVTFITVFNLTNTIPILMDPSASPEEKRHALLAFLGSIGPFLIVFALILPISFEVRSDASIGVSTTFFTHNFTNVVRAFKFDGSTRNNIFFNRSRTSFPAGFSGRVCICQRDSDLIISPQDRDEFVKAVNDVCSQLEREKRERRQEFPQTPTTTTSAMK